VPARATTFFAATLVVSAGFFVSMIPITLTIPDRAVMADQFVMLIVSAIGWIVVATSFVVGVAAPLLHRAAGLRATNRVSPIMIRFGKMQLEAW
jgi:hypothetical protein